MSDKGASLTPQFNRAASMTARHAEIQTRVNHAMQRMNGHFEKCEPALTQARYRQLLEKQGQSPELRPAHARENPQERMWKAAKQMVHYDHRRRLNKIRVVGDRMMGKDRGLER